MEERINKPELWQELLDPEFPNTHVPMYFDFLMNSLKPHIYLDIDKHSLN